MGRPESEKKIEDLVMIRFDFVWDASEAQGSHVGRKFAETSLKVHMPVTYDDQLVECPAQHLAAVSLLRWRFAGARSQAQRMERSVDVRCWRPEILCPGRHGACRNLLVPALQARRLWRRDPIASSVRNVPT